jgi:hypothetical protein
VKKWRQPEHSQNAPEGLGTTLRNGARFGEEVRFGLKPVGVFFV